MPDACGTLRAHGAVTITFACLYEQLKQVIEQNQRQLNELREQNTKEIMARGDLQHQYDLILQQSKVGSYC
jgi:hypothetical protein